MLRCPPRRRALVTMTRGRGCRAFRLDDKTQFSLKLVFDDNYIIADEAWFRITIESWSK